MEDQMETLKKNAHNDVFRVGHKSVDHYDLTAFEAATMTVVAVLSITVGTIYGSLLS